jgi:hypothetical protein
LCCFNRAELVGHCDLVGIVSRLIHSLGRYAARFLNMGDLVVNLIGAASAIRGGSVWLGLGPVERRQRKSSTGPLSY